MNTQDRQRFDEIRYRLERATPGPHDALVQRRLAPIPDRLLTVHIRHGYPTGRLSDESFDGAMLQADMNVEFFAHAWDDIAWLTERVRDMEAICDDHASTAHCDSPDDEARATSAS